MTTAREYDDGVDAEQALKYAVQRVRGGRAEVLEGVIDCVSYGWDHEHARSVLRAQPEYGAPLYLLVDPLEGSVTLFAGPGRLGYTKVDGPHPFGTRVRLPAPFGIDLDTAGLWLRVGEEGAQAGEAGG
ncbi:hypothetical protein ACFYZ4_38205 [Streptomyces sp. NPDC001513]|uniref:hypothetical protein n=1 Tax=Streptomyces sp. NPDC001513 TaxID=3364580 RepID=UPI0036B7C9E7